MPFAPSSVLCSVRSDALCAKTTEPPFRPMATELLTLVPLMDMPLMAVLELSERPKGTAQFAQTCPLVILFHFLKPAPT